MEQTSLTDILSEKEPAKTEVAEVAETPVTETKEADFEVEEKRSKRKKHMAAEWAAQGRDPETGQFVSKEEEKKEPEVKTEVKDKEQQPKVDMSEKERALLKAAEEERRKRQALEAELAQYRQKKEEKPAEKKSFWDDPDGSLKTVEQTVDQKLSQKELNIVLRTSEMIARSKYKDFDDNIAEFAEVLKATPGLHAQWLASPDPAEFAYRFGERTRLIKEAGSIDELKARIEKETRAKLEAEYKQKQKDLESQRAALTPSLSDVRGAVKQSQPVFTGPTPFEDILKP